MRIDNWPLDRILMLPDWCFGRRWQVSLHANSVIGVPGWDISEIGLPEYCVLWEWAIISTEAWVAADRWRIALGHQLPTTLAMMDELEPLINGLGIQGAEPRQIIGPQYTPFAIRKLRQVIHSGSRRVILEVDGAESSTRNLMVLLVFSSMPKEVPDWLISGQAANLL